MDNESENLKAHEEAGYIAGYSDALLHASQAIRCVESLDNFKHKFTICDPMVELNFIHFVSCLRSRLEKNKGIYDKKRNND
jgi:hypothetical protein